MKNILQTVYDTMMSLNLAEPITLEFLLQSSGITVDTYIEALRLSTKRHMVILKREAHEKFVNNYHSLFLKTWRANIDIQFVLDPYACVMYVTSYLCKSERTMSELLKQASNQFKKRDMNIKEKLSVLGNVFLTYREMSTDEAIYRLLSIPLKVSNRKDIFLPTGLPEQRTRLLKSKKELESLPDDSVDIFQTSIVGRYAARPKTIQHMCYADFASQYVTGSNTKQDNNLDDAVKVRNSKRQSITLEKNLEKCTV